METNENKYKKIRISPPYFIYQTVIHLIAFYGIYSCIIGSTHRKTIYYNFLLGYISLIGVVVGVHRLWSHRSFKANLPLRILLAIMQTFTHQESILIWCRNHRVHHKNSDTNADPYNIRRGFFFAHFGWLITKKTRDFYEKAANIDLSDLNSDPVVRIQHKYYFRLLALLWIISISIPCYLWDETIANSITTIALQYIVILHHTCCINSVAHMFGMKPYDTGIEPRFSKIGSYITLGEGYHNFHHTFPYDYLTSEYSGFNTYNVSGLIIDFFALIGWAFDRKKANKDLVNKRRIRTGDSNVIIKSKNILLEYVMGIIIYTSFLWILLLIRYFKHLLSKSF